MGEALKDLHNLLEGAGYARVMSNVLERDFDSVEKYAQYEISILGDKVKESMDSRAEQLYDFFYFTKPVREAGFLDNDLVANLERMKLVEGDKARWAIYPFKGKYFLAEPQYTHENGMRRCLKRLEQPWGSVYIGFDSFLLAEHLEPRKGDSVLDLCCGSGIQGIMCADAASQITGVDISETCVEVSRMNAILNSVEHKSRFLLGDLYRPVKGERFDYICSNVPYLAVPEGSEYTLEGNGGPDGLAMFRRVLEGLPEHLTNKGRACFTVESTVDYSKELKELEDAGLKTEVKRLHSIKNVDDYIKTKVEDAYSEDVLEKELQKWRANYARLGVKQVSVDIVKIWA